ncbi:hypothetical protein VIGAN_05231200, partial [Vigna angularis var. angularis]
SIFYDSLDDATAESVEVGKVIFEEPTQVCSNLEIQIAISELPIQFNTFDSLSIDPIKIVASTDVIVDSKVFKAAFEIEHIHTPTVFTDDICPC